MDEEGFPLLSLDSNVNSDDLVMEKDRESGETTTQQVVVFRRPPRDASHPQAFQIQMNVLRLYRAVRQPIGGFSQRSCPSLPSRDSQFEEDAKTRQKPKSRFRVPQERPQASGYEVKEASAMTISVWKEVFLGVSVFDYGSLGWKEITRRYPYPYWLRRPLEALNRHLPLLFLRLAHLLILILRFILRDVCIIGLYSTRLYTHLRIHQISQERGIQPVFTGRVCHGPITYGVRLRCTFCRQQQQAAASFRYLQSMREERRNAR